MINKCSQTQNTNISITDVETTLGKFATNNPKLILYVNNFKLTREANTSVDQISVNTEEHHLSYDIHLTNIKADIKVCYIYVDN